jgi:serine/threonine protein kinase
MTRKSIFGLDPEKLDRLLSIGADGVDGGESEDNRSQPAGKDASARESEGPSPAASLGISAEQPGSRIGPYRLLSVLGEGGMGIVYLAEQEQPIRRQVALKIIKPGMDSKRVIARFEAERQALALLDHPNIAHVHDAGATESGRPYFVMEYVEGLAISEHCDRHKLTIEERLGLFLQLCHAVHHAHQKGIIHRDIKPSNILVASIDDQAVPKIIDFGVAKAVSQPLTERTLYTEQGQLFGTPEYMSPEQANMANEDVDTRSDIYSLGVLLYVLLTGALPFDSKELREGGVDHIRQVIRETEPKTPSTRLTGLGEEAKNAAENRGTAVATLARCLHRELEWIPLKAMRKERAERYQSASELAGDIQNYLNGDPLVAGPPSAVYRVKKIVRRHWALVLGIAAVLVVLVGGIIVSTVFAIGQARASAEAEQQEAVSRAVTDFVTNDLLGAASPWGTGGRELTARLLLDMASENVTKKFRDKPLIEAAIRSMLGNNYRLIGDFDVAEQHLERSLEIQRELLGEEHLDTLHTMHRLIRLYANQSRYKEAEPFAVKVLETRGRVLGEEHVDTLMSMQDLAWVYRDQGRYNEAEPLHIKNLQMTRRVLGEEHLETSVAMKGLGALYRKQGRFNEAAELLAETLEIDRRVRGEEYPSTLATMCHLALVYRDQGRYGEAEALFREMLDIRCRVLGEEHPHSLDSLRNLIELYETWPKPAEAERWRAKLDATGDRAE